MREDTPASPVPLVLIFLQAMWRKETPVSLEAVAFLASPDPEVTHFSVYFFYYFTIISQQKLRLYILNMLLSSEHLKKLKYVLYVFFYLARFYIFIRLVKKKSFISSFTVN